MSNNKREFLKRLGVLWVRKSKEGTIFLSGFIEHFGEDVPVVAFQNRKKTQENHPDYIICRGSDRDAIKSTDLETAPINTNAKSDDIPVIDNDATPDLDVPPNKNTDDEVNVDNIPF